MFLYKIYYAGNYLKKYLWCLIVTYTFNGDLKVQVNLDLNKPYVSQRPAFKMNLAKPTEELLERNISTGKLNLIKNGLAKKR